MTKRRYMNGYHIEWASRQSVKSTTEELGAEIPEVSAEENRVEEYTAEDIPQDSTDLEKPSFVEPKRKAHTNRLDSPNLAQFKERLAENRTVKAVWQVVVNSFDKSEYRTDEGWTGIKWLDFTLGVVLLIALIAFWIYTKPNYGAEISAAWAAFTANIWISILYILLFLLVAALLWAALDALFGAMFPSD